MARNLEPHASLDELRVCRAVTNAGPVDGKRRKELKDLFAGCKAGLMFVTDFETRRARLLRSRERENVAKPDEDCWENQIAWDSEVWIADDPDHMIHFDGERFLGRIVK